MPRADWCVWRGDVARNRVTIALTAFLFGFVIL